MSDTLPPVAGQEPSSTTVRQPESPPPTQPRLRAVLIILILQWLIMIVPGWIAPGTMIQFMGWSLGPLLGLLGLVGWWLFASGVPRRDRWLVLLAFLLALGALLVVRDESMFVPVLLFYGIPVATTAWGLWLLATPWLRWPVRQAGLILVFWLAWGVFALLRFNGTTGTIAPEFAWRWAATNEDRFAEEQAKFKATGDNAAPATSIVLQAGDWPGFRGPQRDGRLTGVRIATNWNEQPPRQLWRHRVGPGWGSFAVIDKGLYTQEQRKDEEVVVCYDTDSGVERWVHADKARFNEAMAGPGPRATPTFHDGKIYAQGATGRLNCLNAASGKIVWWRDIAADAVASIPQWGFASSPLIVDGIVTVFAGGPGKHVLAYDASTGQPVWSGGEGARSYCSLHPARIGDALQLVLATEQGLIAFEPKTGQVLWRHDWPIGNMSRTMQPVQIGDADFLLGTGFGNGTRRVHVSAGNDGWSTSEVWTSTNMKPYFNDLVAHKDHLYGFDNNFLTCVRLDNGKKTWRERGYGNGQVLLLADQDLLLVVCESGEIALVEAKPEAHTELARFAAIEGKTWNHPVVAHGKLFVRNGIEAACYELTVK